MRLERAVKKWCLVRYWFVQRILSGMFSLCVAVFDVCEIMILPLCLLDETQRRYDFFLFEKKLCTLFGNFGMGKISTH